MNSFEINQTDNRAIKTNGINLDETESDRTKKDLDKYQKMFSIDEDSFDQPATTRKELWSYYLYSNVRVNSPFELRDILTVNL